MKKYLLFVLSFCIINLIYSQITITQTNMPSIGDTIRYSNSPVGTLNFINTGANYSWDYSNLGFTNQDVYKFQGLTSTPYATLAFSGMPFGAIGYKIADSIGQGQVAFKNIYNFYEKRSADWRAVGTGFTLSALPFPAGGVYSDKDEIYKFPLNYNDYDSTTFSITTPLGNQFIQLGTYKQKGYRKTTVEGWGKITTPYASNISCLKIKSEIFEIDSLKISTPSFNVGFPNNRVEYKWLSTTEKIPLLEVVGNQVGNTFVPITIRYRDNYRASLPNLLLPKVSFSVNKNSGLANKDTFTLQNNTTPNFGVTYSWAITPSAGLSFANSSTATSKNPQLVFANPGKYSVKLTATNFAGSKDSTATDMITITDNSSLNTIFDNNSYFYPNPVINQLNFNHPDFEGKSVKIFNNLGQLVFETIVSKDLSINLSDLIKGTYLMVIIDQQSILYNQFIKQ